MHNFSVDAASVTVQVTIYLVEIILNKVPLGGLHAIPYGGMPPEAETWGSWYSTVAPVPPDAVVSLISLTLLSVKQLWINNFVFTFANFPNGHLVMV